MTQAPAYDYTLLASALLVAGWWAVLRALRDSPWQVAVMSLGGTLLHELAHFVVGFVLRARPSTLVIFPRRDGNHWVLGSVQFENLHLWNAAPVALAPLLLAPGSFLALLYGLPALLASDALAAWVGSAYLTTAGLQACLPSRTDWKVGALSLLAYTGVAAGVYLVARTVMGFSGP